MLSNRRIIDIQAHMQKTELPVLWFSNISKRCKPVTVKGDLKYKTQNNKV